MATVALLLAILAAIFAGPAAPGIERGAATFVPGAFVGLTWQCNPPYSDEECYAGAVVVDGAWTLQTGP